MVRGFVDRLLRRGMSVVALVCPLLVPAVSNAQRAPQLPRYEVTGFRDTRFGMSEQEVRATLREVLGTKDDDITARTNAIDGTTRLIVHVRALEPSLGEGRIEYLFGYKTHGLVQANVIWGLDTNPPNNNSALISAAARLQRYFLGFSWAAKSVRAGIPIDEGAVLLFAGEDGKGGSVALTIEGVRYDLDPNGVVRFYPQRLSPPRLTLS